jgi:hypothetical protein
MTFTHNGHEIDIRQNGKFIELWIDGKFVTSHRGVDDVSRETAQAKFLRKIRKLAPCLEK